MTQKLLIVSCVVASVILLWVTFSTGTQTKDPSHSVASSTPVVRTEGDQQIIHVLARGGYQPHVVEARAGLTTRLEVETRGTYDCSASFTIPDLSVRKMLPATGVTAFDIPKQEAGSTIHALCGMGMYTLDLHFN